MPVRFRAVLPETFNSRAFRSVLADGMSEFMKSPLADIKSTVDTWSSDKPDFKTKRFVFSDHVTVTIYLSGSEMGIRKWNWIDQGTEAHQIVAKNASLLRFPGTFTPKTQPGAFQSGAGTRAGPMRYAKSVWNPGIAARNWRELLVANWQSLLEREMERAIRRAANASGHGVE